MNLVKQVHVFKNVGIVNTNSYMYTQTSSCLLDVRISVCLCNCSESLHTGTENTFMYTQTSICIQKRYYIHGL